MSYDVERVLVEYLMGNKKLHEVIESKGFSEDYQNSIMDVCELALPMLGNLVNNVQ